MDPAGGALGQEQMKTRQEALEPLGSDLDCESPRALSESGRLICDLVAAEVVGAAVTQLVTHELRSLKRYHKAPRRLRAVLCVSGSRLRHVSVLGLQHELHRMLSKESHSLPLLADQVKRRGEPFTLGVVVKFANQIEASMGRYEATLRAALGGTLTGLFKWPPENASDVTVAMETLAEALHAAEGSLAGDSTHHLVADLLSALQMDVGFSAERAALQQGIRGALDHSLSQAKLRLVGALTKGLHCGLRGDQLQACLEVSEQVFNIPAVAKVLVRLLQDVGALDATAVEPLTTPAASVRVSLRLTLEFLRCETLMGGTFRRCALQQVLSEAPHEYPPMGRDALRYWWDVQHRPLHQEGTYRNRSGYRGAEAGLDSWLKETAVPVSEAVYWELANELAGHCASEESLTDLASGYSKGPPRQNYSKEALRAVAQRLVEELFVPELSSLLSPGVQLLCNSAQTMRFFGESVAQEHPQGIMPPSSLWDLAAAHPYRSTEIPADCVSLIAERGLTVWGNSAYPILQLQFLSRRVVGELAVELEQQRVQLARQRLGNGLRCEWPPRSPEAAEAWHQIACELEDWNCQGVARQRLLQQIRRAEEAFPSSWSREESQAFAVAFLRKHEEAVSAWFLQQVRLVSSLVHLWASQLRSTATRSGCSPDAAEMNLISLGSCRPDPAEMDLSSAVVTVPTPRLCGAGWGLQEDVGGIQIHFDGLGVEEPTKKNGAIKSTHRHLWSGGDVKSHWNNHLPSDFDHLSNICDVQGFACKPGIRVNEFEGTDLALGNGKIQGNFAAHALSPSDRYCVP